MERIVFLERNTIQANFRRPNFNHKWIEYPETLAEQVVERARDATIIISNKLPLGESELSPAPNLKLIAIAATGSAGLKPWQTSRVRASLHPSRRPRRTPTLSTAF